MIYKTIASFKYRGHTISVREERATTEGTPDYVLYEGRRLYSGWRYHSKRDAMAKLLSAITDFCHI